MPMIMTMPIIAVMLSSTPVSHRPTNTALVEISEVTMMMTGIAEALVQEQQQDDLGRPRRRRTP